MYEKFPKSRNPNGKSVLWNAQLRKNKKIKFL